MHFVLHMTSQILTSCYSSTLCSIHLKDKTQQNLTGSSEGTLKGESCKPFCVLTFDLLHVPGWLLLTPKGSPTPSWGSNRRAVDAEFLFENLPYVPDLTRFFRISRSRLIRFHVLFFLLLPFFFFFIDTCRTFSLWVWNSSLKRAVCSLFFYYLCFFFFYPSSFLVGNVIVFTH